MANKNGREIEIQVRVEKIGNLLKFLKQNAQFIGSEHQIDTYYSPIKNSFIDVRPVREWLRLRNSSGKYTVTYKNIRFEEDGRTHDKVEFESEIKDITQLENIFLALNFKPIVTVDKKRQIYVYKAYEVSIDSVDNLGDFVEIEYKGEVNSKKPSDITQEMVDFLRKNGCGKILRNYSGYPHQILFPNEVVSEEYH